MAYKFIDLQVDNHIATVTLAKMENLNALDIPFSEEIAGVFGKLNTHDEVRAVILCSRTKAFCTGLDLKAFNASMGIDKSAKGSLEFPEKLKAIFDSCNMIEVCRKPVIAAVHGMCVGGGLDIISACDIRLCTEDASFSLREAAVGFVADAGVLQRLPHIIGQGFTREMAFTARFYNAKEAESMGLVTTVYLDREALMEGARSLARLIAQNAPLAVQETKEVLNMSRHASIEDGMSLAKHKNMVLLFSEDLKEAFLAFVEKRKPNYQGR
jgi:enoyl-CoA hydratase